MPRDEPSFIIAPGECDEFGAQFLDGFERSHPEQVLLQGSDEPLCDAIALGFAHEGRRSFDAQTFDLVLEIAGHVIGAMIVTQLEPTRHAGAMAPKHRCTPWRTGSSASKRLAERAA